MKIVPIVEDEVLQRGTIFYQCLALNRKVNATALPVFIFYVLLILLILFYTASRSPTRYSAP